MYFKFATKAGVKTSLGSRRSVNKRHKLWTRGRLESHKTERGIAPSIFPRPAESARWAMIGFCDWTVIHAVEISIAKTAVNQACVYLVHK